MSAELSDQQLDILLSSADGFVGQGGPLVDQLAAAVRQLRRSLVTVNVPGRTLRLDRLGECEDALDSLHAYITGLESERDVLAAIVRDLATHKAPYNSEWMRCDLCDSLIELHAPEDGEIDTYVESHAESCTWRRARAWLASQEPQT